MSNTKGNLIVAQGGGPTPVINCSLYGVIKAAAAKDCIDEIIGARHGITGVLNENFIDLRSQPKDTIEGLLTTPASALGSCRCKLTENDYEKIMNVFRQRNIRYFLYNGGNDSMDTANKIHQLAQNEGYELHVCGIPKTVDNDLPITDHCPGYGSAARYLAQSVRDVGVDVRSLPIPITIFEAMGRNAGWLAASSALAKTDPDSAPQLIYLPETPFEIDTFLADVESVYKRLGWALVVVSEGIKKADGTDIHSSAEDAQKDGFGHTLPGDVGSYLARKVATCLKLRCRNEKPGLCGRSSILCVSSVDREEARQAGQAAVEQVAKGQSGKMITLVRQPSKNYKCSTGTAPLSEVANVEKVMPEEFIDRENHFVTKAFYDYAKPLIGEELLNYVRLG